jgi:hypothetical protein
MLQSLNARVSSLQDEANTIRRKADEARVQANEQSEQLMTVISALKQDHQQVCGYSIPMQINGKKLTRCDLSFVESVRP